ncbi:MAG: phospholipase [Cytophagales bacterium]|nr:MAG: phospholipase [Cytophagales bacterium]
MKKRHNLRLTSISMSIFVLLCACEAQNEKNIMTQFESKIWVSAQKDTLRYRWLIPKDYEPSKKYPLVIFLHGVYQRGDDNIRQTEDIAHVFLDETHRKNYPCFLIAPQCPKDSYWANFVRDEEGKRALGNKPTLSIGLLIKLIKQLPKEYAIDTDRIYITGLSMGAFGTFDLLMREPELFAAAVPICGGGVPSYASVFKHVPIWIFHGAEDEVVPVQYSREMVKALENAGGSPLYTEYPAIKHDSWTPAYQEPQLFDWLFSQKKENQHSEDPLEQ